MTTKTLLSNGAIKVNSPKDVQIKIDQGGKRLWVRVDGKTRLRIDQIEPGTPFAIEGLQNARLTAFP